MSRSICRFLAVLLLPVFLLTGCWDMEPEPESGSLLPAEEEEPETTEAKVILPESFSLPYAPDQTLDPVICPDGMQQVVGALMYEGLFALDETLSPQPTLCSSYAYDPATFTYIFTLRTDVTFSDGSAFTAADAAATLQRARTSERYRARLAQVSSISASGQTLVITLSQANTGFPALLDIPIVKSGTEGSLAPLGTGPYYLSTADGNTALVANTSWWRGASLPVSRITLSAASDRDAMLYQFTSHDVQLITADLTGTTPISATGNVSFQDADTTILQYVGFNMQRSIFQDAKLRRALGLGINRSNVVSAFLSGHGTDTQFPISPLCNLYPEQLEQAFSYDAYANAMAAAGYNEGKHHRLTMIVNAENTFKVSAAEYIASSWSAFDLEIEVQALPWEEYTAALQSGNYDLYYGEVKLTADWNLAQLLGSGGSLNYGRWADPQTDQLLTAYASASDREAAMESLCRYLAQQAPILPVCFKSTSVLMQSGVVEGLSPTMTNPLYNFSSCTVHLREPE